MAVTPGSSAKINKVKGVAKAIRLSNQDMTTYAAKVFTSDLFIVGENKKIYLSDGATAVNALTPIIDTAIAPLTANERAGLTNTYSGQGGIYKATEGGFVVLGAAGADGHPKIDDAQLKLVDAGGHLVGSYLQEVLTDEHGIVKLDKLPDQMRRHMVFVANYAAIESLTATQKLDLIFVTDASDDPSGEVTSGWAIYAFNVNEGAATGDPIKISEGEGLDIDLDELGSSYENVQEAGAIMYDHTIQIEAPTLDEYFALVDFTNLPAVTVQTKPNDYTGPASTEVASGLVLACDDAESSITVTLTGKRCKLKADGEPTAEITTTGNLAAVNGWLATAKVVIGNTNGEVTVKSNRMAGPVTIPVKLGAAVPPPPAEEKTCELTTKPASYDGESGAEVASGLAFTGTEDGNIVVTLTAVDAQLKEGEGVATDTLTKTDTMTNVNAWLGTIKVVVGSVTGSVTVECDKIEEDTEIPVNVTPAA